MTIFNEMYTSLWIYVRIYAYTQIRMYVCTNVTMWIHVSETASVLDWVVTIIDYLLCRQPLRCLVWELSKCIPDETVVTRSQQQPANVNGFKQSESDNDNAHVIMYLCVRVCDKRLLDILHRNLKRQEQVQYSLHRKL